MDPTTVLPGAYERRGEIDLSKNQVAAVAMNIVAFGLLLPIGWLLAQFVAFTRADLLGSSPPSR